MIYKVKFFIDFINEPIKDAGIVLKNYKVVEVGNFKLVRSKYKDNKILDYKDYIAIPPIVNAHTHLELTDIPREKLNFSSHIDWILSLIKVKKEIANRRFLINSYKKGLARLKEYNTFFYGNIISKEIGDVDNNMNFIELICYSENEVEEVVNQFSVFKKISPHTFFTVHPFLMEKIFSLNLPLSIHLFESKDEIEYLYEMRGEVIKKLFKATGLEKIKEKIDIENFIFYLLEKYHNKVQFIHLCYLTKSFEQFLIKNRNKIIPTLCPRSNYYLKNKLNYDFFLKNNIPFSLGTDSLMSNDDLNVFNEAKFIFDNLEKFDKEKVALQLFQALTINGFKSIFLEYNFYPLMLIQWESSDFSYKELFENFLTAQKFLTDEN